MSVDRGETRVALLESTESAGQGGAKGAGAQNGESTSTGGRRRRGRGGGGGGRGRGGAPKGYRVAELYFERRSNRSIVGNVYKGRVDNVLPGLEAAFVDIGLEKNAFLHVDEIRLPGVKVQRRGHGGGGDHVKISDLIKPGDELVVQVTKDPLKTKGARVTMDLTIAGRYLVYAPRGEGVGVSKKVDDQERNRLRKEVKDLELHGGGAIVRTAARGAVREDFERELPYLFKLHEVLEQRAQESKGPCMVFQEADLSVRVVRDIFSSEFEKAIVDDPQQVQRLQSFFTRTAPELVDKVELWEESSPLFEAHDVEEVIDGLLGRRVDLPSGGYLMIDYGEALTVIDVNSGSFTGKGKQARLEDTITRTNLEAAEAVVNELRLRDIGGIIVIDFIDMARVKNQRDVLKTLRDKLGDDRTKTFTAEISKLGLVEMTRQNVTEGVREVITRACPTCDGDGVIKSEETLAIEFERQLREIASRAPESSQAFLVRMHPGVVAEFTGQSAKVLHQLEAQTGRYFVFEGTERLPLDDFEVVMEGSIDAVRERAIPFQEGEEVLVQIVEPHMYNVDDAVAKVGGYVVSVTNGGRFVGEKKLVRIERAGRTSASAVLVGPDAVLPADKPAAPDGSFSATGTTNKRSSRRRRGARAKAEQQEAVEQEQDEADGFAARDERAEPDADFDEPVSTDVPVDAAELEEAADEVAEAARAVVEAADGVAASSDDDDQDDERPAPRRRRSRGGRGRSGGAAATQDGDGERDDDVDGDGGARSDADDDDGEPAGPAGRRRSRGAQNVTEAGSAESVEVDDDAAGEPAADAGDGVTGDDADDDGAPKPRRRSRGRGRRGRGGAKAADGDDADDVSSPVRRRTGGARRSAASPEDLASGETAEPISSE
ncbi:Rne/Rng family ribonuclease [Patulibacter sp. NPDC049589]|uniref:Rne/Rng family ribonuclease n=1 Tax=Patulibacter sp. NPDC049589 TaxID=3154731 RepID=UPI00343D4701